MLKRLITRIRQAWANANQPEPGVCRDCGRNDLPPGTQYCAKCGRLEGQGPRKDGPYRTLQRHSVTGEWQEVSSAIPPRRRDDPYR